MVSISIHSGKSTSRADKRSAIDNGHRGLPLSTPNDPESSVLYGRAFPNSAYNTPAFTNGTTFVYESDLTGVTDHVAFGSYASVPARGLGFYFSGMTSFLGDELWYNAAQGGPHSVNTTSNQFVRVDMDASNPSSSIQANFTNSSLPLEVLARAEGALIWLPYGEDGVLLALGGTQTPYELWMDQPTSQDNDFMDTVALYDINQDQWHLQQTNGGKNGQTPGQRAAFCAVTTASQDGTQAIYVYGGDAGTPEAIPGDDIWVLSVPSFIWTKVYDVGDTAHGRRLHSCFTPNPTTMISIGGTAAFNAPLNSDTAIDIFDLQSLEWTGNYDATSVAEYTTPNTVSNNIANGPELNATLTTLFAQIYSKVPTTTYPSNCSASSPSSTPVPPKPQPWKYPVIGAVCGVVGLAIVCGLLFCWWKKRKTSSQGAARTEMRDKKVMSWFGRSSNAGHDPVPETSHASGDTGNTMVANEPDYFAAKMMQNEVYEAPSSAVTSPGYYSPRHGTPYVTSPALSGSHEVDASSRFEMMDGDMRGPMSIREHPAYPLSIQGEFITSARSDITPVSYPSESISAARHHGGVSPYELPQDHSNEDLRPPPDLSLSHGRALPKESVPGKSFGIDADPVQSPSEATPQTPVTRKPVGSSHRGSMGDALAHRPSHQRNASSISSNIPNLPSPNPEEDRRRSRFIDALPDSENQALNATTQTNRRSMMPGRVSAYQENFDENMNRRTWAGQNTTL